jgi:hypothetical protein
MTVALAAPSLDSRECPRSESSCARAGRCIRTRLREAFRQALRRWPIFWTCTPTLHPSPCLEACVQSFTLACLFPASSWRALGRRCRSARIKTSPSYQECCCRGERAPAERWTAAIHPSPRVRRCGRWRCRLSSSRARCQRGSDHFTGCRCCTYRHCAAERVVRIWCISLLLACVIRLARGTTHALARCVCFVSFAGVASPPDRCVAAPFSAHARAHDVNLHARAQGPGLQPAVGLAAQLARVADDAHECSVRRGSCPSVPRPASPSTRSLDVCVVSSSAGMTSPPESGVAAPALGSRACPRSKSSCARRSLDSNQLSGLLPSSLGSLTTLKNLCVVDPVRQCLGPRHHPRVVDACVFRILLLATSPSDRCMAAAFSAHARAHDVNLLARAQAPVLEPAVWLTAQLARVPDLPHRPVRRGPARQRLGPRHHPRNLSMCVFCLLLLGVTPPPDRGVAAPALGSRACPRSESSCARAGTWTPTSCRARCPARSGH